MRSAYATIPSPRPRRFVIEPLEERVVPTCSCVMPSHHHHGHHGHHGDGLFLGQSQFQFQSQSQSQFQFQFMSLSDTLTMSQGSSMFNMMA